MALRFPTPKVRLMGSEQMTQALSLSLSHLDPRETIRGASVISERTRFDRISMEIQCSTDDENETCSCPRRLDRLSIEKETEESNVVV